MKIRLAILEKDQNYLERIVHVFTTKYADKFEIYSFTDKNVAMETLESAKIDVFLVNDLYTIDVKDIPRRCGFAYLVDDNDVETINDQRAICKFQKADIIYKNIVSIYSENTKNISGVKLDDDSTRIILFTSPSGGAGSSSMASACAIHFAQQGYKTLYVNIEKYGSTDIIFDGEGNFDMSDVIFAVKSKKANLALKLESCVKQSQNGVYFYSQPKIALDMLEMGSDDIITLINQLNISSDYDYMIIDADFSLDKDSLSVWRIAHAIIWTGDGSELSNSKIFRAYTALDTIEQNNDSPITNRISLIYNKFSNKTSKAIGDIGIKNIGGAPVYVHSNSQQVVFELCKINDFDKIFDER